MNSPDINAKLRSSLISSCGTCCQHLDACAADMFLAAVRSGHVECIRALLTANPEFDVNARLALWFGYGHAIHLACDNNHFAVVKLLVESGARCDVLDEDSTTPLFLAAKVGNLEMVQFLFERPGVVDQLNLACSTGQTPFWVACAFRRHDVAFWLAHQGAVVDTVLNDGSNLIHLAARSGDGDLIRYLVERGVDPSARRSDGQDALFIATRMGHLDMVKFFHEELHLAFAPESEIVCPPMVAAVQSWNVEMVKLLLSYGVPARSNANLYPSSALTTAAASGMIEIIRLLVKRGAHVHDGGPAGLTPIAEAVANRRDGAVRLLLAEGADANIVRTGSVGSAVCPALNAWQIASNFECFASLLVRCLDHRKVIP